MPTDPNYLARYRTLCERHPSPEGIANQFVGWFCGSANRQRLNPQEAHRSLADELELFLTTYEKEIPATASE